MTKQHFFITGTDTDSGKTYVVTQLLKAFRHSGKSVVALKPLASGCTLQQGQLISPDAACFQSYHSSALEISGWKFEAPIAPHLAAQEAMQRISAIDIQQFCLQSAFNAYDYCLIEGAGGLMVPLNDVETWVDFIKLMQIPILLVVGMQLGCINHALLTAEVITKYQLPCAGWIANFLQPTMLRPEENLATLQTRMPIPFLCDVNYQGEIAQNVVSALCAE